MKIQRMKCQNWKLLHLEYTSSMVKFYIIILLIIQPKFILAQDEVLQGEDDYIYDFAKEAVRRGITTPHDSILVEHEEYCEKWYTYCDVYFGRK